MASFVPRFLWTVALLAALAVIGTAGYMLIEQQPLGDALYMTAITLSAVGYNEVFPLSAPGRVFTMLLLLSGITWLGFWFANLTSLIVELDLKDALRRRRSMRDIAKMKDHVIICGCGRTGRQIAQELETMDSEYVILERSPERIEEVREFLPHAHIMEGDATHDQLLLEAGLLRAKGLITCLSQDADNLFVCLSARDLAATVKIVARAYEEETMSKLYRAGADHVVSPNVSSAIRMASVLLRPSAVTFLDIATRSSHLDLRMEQTVIGDRSSVVDKSLVDARIPQQTGLIVIAIHKSGTLLDEYTFNPKGDTTLKAGDEIIVLGTEQQIEKLQQLVQ
ncbi:MAG: potassium channel protein [Gemmatimonadota bacterium]